MKRSILVSVTMLFCAVGCTALKKDNSEIVEAHALRIGIDEFKRRNKSSLQDYRITLKTIQHENELSWLVFFEGTSPAVPGNHFFIFVSKRTGRITFMPGT